MPNISFSPSMSAFPAVNCADCGVRTQARRPEPIRYSRSFPGIGQGRIREDSSVRKTFKKFDEVLPFLRTDLEPLKEKTFVGIVGAHAFVGASRDGAAARAVMVNNLIESPNASIVHVG